MVTNDQEHAFICYLSPHHSRWIKFRIMTYEYDVEDRGVDEYIDLDAWHFEE